MKFGKELIKFLRNYLDCGFSADDTVWIANHEFAEIASDTTISDKGGSVDRHTDRSVAQRNQCLAPFKYLEDASYIAVRDLLRKRLIVTFWRSRQIDRSICP